MRTRFLCIALTALSVCLTARAQVYSVSPIGIDMGSSQVWTFTPILVTENEQTQVHSFLALKDPASTVGTNITVVWYLHASEGGWAPVAWNTQDHWQVIKSIKDVLAIPDWEDNLWQTFQGPPEVQVATAEMPKAFVSGVLSDDPLVIPLSSQTNQTMLDLLVNLGYAAASVPVDDSSETQCTSAEVIDAMQTGVNSFVAAPATDATSAAQTATAALATCQMQFCIAWNWYGTPTCGAWACGAWGPESANPPGAGPIQNGACSDICHYERTTTRTCSRTKTHQAWDCTQTGWTQYRTDTGEQKGRCDIDLSNAGCVHFALPCPTATTCLAGVACAPSPSTIVYGTWAP